jgi:hypothetical protein
MESKTNTKSVTTDKHAALSRRPTDIEWTGLEVTRFEGTRRTE